MHTSVVSSAALNVNIERKQTKINRLDFLVSRVIIILYGVQITLGESCTERGAESCCLGNTVFPNINKIAQI